MLTYNCPFAGSQFCPGVKIFLVFADTPGMKQFFQGLVLGVLLMYWYLNFSTGLLHNLPSWPFGAH